MRLGADDALCFPGGLCDRAVFVITVIMFVITVIMLVITVIMLVITVIMLVITVIIGRWTANPFGAASYAPDGTWRNPRL